MSSSSSLPPSSPSLRMCKYSSVCLTSIPFFYRQALWCGSVSGYFVANLEMLHTINTVMEEYRFEWNLLSASANTMFSSFLEYNLNPRHRYLFSLPTEFLPHHQAMIIRVFFYDSTEAPRCCVRGARLVFAKVHAVPYRHASIFHGC